MVKLIVFYFLLHNIRLVLTTNILFISPISSHSHHMWNRVIALELVNRGYNVTYMTPNKDAVTMKNYTVIQFEDLMEHIEGSFDANEMHKNNQLQMIQESLEWGRFNCKHNLGTQGLKTILNYPKNFKFDLILYDVTIGYCLYPLIVKFNYPPTIGVTVFLLPTFVSNFLGNNLYSSYIPYYAAPYSNEMTFYQRLLNYVLTRYDLYLRITQIHNANEIDARKVFGDDIPRWYEVERHFSLVLANTDPIMDYPQPLTPNIIPVAGLHIKPPKRIPDELQKILDNATNGVIVFSLGTLIRSDKLNDKQKTVFLEAFSRMNETIIWKYESQLENVSENVIIRKWIPQSDLLTHRNVKLFIGHGGASSTQEALYHGVPMIAVPFIVDQYYNAHLIVQKHVGLIINIDQITPDYVYNTIREGLDNTIYRRNMKKISEKFHDQPQKPMERAIFWIEYMLRHGGEDFLSPKARDLPFYQTQDIDVIAFLATLLILILIIFSKLFRFFLKLSKTTRKIKIN